MPVRLFDQMVTRVAGAMSGPEWESRQGGLKELRETLDQGIHVVLELIPEPENPYDTDAIRVECVLARAGRVQLGYVKNSNGFCDLCHKPFERFPKRCPGCRHSDYLRRDGAATRIATALREEPGLQIYGEVLEVTGGTEDKQSFGCNIIVKSMVRPPAFPTPSAFPTPPGQ